MGKLVFKYGTRGAGKTMHLLMAAHNFEEKGISTLCIKPTTDTRSKDIKSRNGISHICYNIEYNDSNFLEYLIKTIYPQVILVDEAQFFSKEFIRSLDYLIRNLNIHTICYGLRTDSNGDLFEGSSALFALADEIGEIESYCSCGNKTIINGRKNSDGEFILSNNIVEIGAEDKYEAVCKYCWTDKLKEDNHWTKGIY